MARSGDDLQRNYAHGTLVIWPPDAVREPVNQLRQRYDPASQAICDAHITLTQPFLTKPDEQDWQGIEAVLARFNPFALGYGPLNSFLPYPCVYLEIEPRETIMRLRSALHETGLFNLSLPFSDDSFIPHMSITDGSPDEGQTRSIIAALAVDEPRGHFLCDRIAYIRPDAAFHFEVARELPLRGTHHGH